MSEVHCRHRSTQAIIEESKVSHKDDGDRPKSAVKRPLTTATSCHHPQQRDRTQPLLAVLKTPQELHIYFTFNSRSISMPRRVFDIDVDLTKVELWQRVTQRGTAAVSSFRKAKRQLVGLCSVISFTTRSAPQLQCLTVCRRIVGSKLRFARDIGTRVTH